MNIFKNKYFLLGNLAFLLLVIPVALFFIKNQTSTRGSAAPTTTLSFNPPNLTPSQCEMDKSTKLILNPSQNIVSTVQLALKWDKTKFDIVFEPNKTAFSQTLKGPESTATGMSITVNIGADVTKAINTTTEVGTITVKPLEPTNGSVINLEIDATGTKIYSLSQQDGTTENVFNSAGSSVLPISIAAATCTGVSTTPSVTDTTTPSPTTAPGVPTATPTTASAPTATPTVGATATPTTAVVNSSPVCLNLSSSVSSGSAPLSLTLTAAGQDTDGTVAKATFNFGDGTQQDVTTGMGTASVSAQLAHTYTSGGNFSATAVFTDNSGAVSSTCTQQIVVSGAVATMAPTATPTVVSGGILATDTPTNTPTIAPTGSIGATIGIIGGIVLAIFAGVFLLAL